MGEQKTELAPLPKLPVHFNPIKSLPAAEQVALVDAILSHYENGRTIYDVSKGTGSHPYRPDPHLIHLGSPIGRACACDATMPGITIKNVWASSRPRPAFPGE